MARKKIAKSISYDPKRKLYYVTLYYGKVEGKAKKETRTFAPIKTESLRAIASDETIKSELAIDMTEINGEYVEEDIEDAT